MDHCASSSEENEDDAGERRRDIEEEHVQPLTANNKHFFRDKTVMKKRKTSIIESIEPVEH